LERGLSTKRAGFKRDDRGKVKKSSIIGVGRGRERTQRSSEVGAGRMVARGARREGKPRGGSNGESRKRGIRATTSAKNGENGGWGWLGGTGTLRKRGQIRGDRISKTAGWERGFCLQKTHSSTGRGKDDEKVN